MSATTAKRCVRPNGQAAELEYDESSLSALYQALRTNTAPADLVLFPRRTWKQVPSLQAEIDFAECYRLDRLAILRRQGNFSRERVLPVFNPYRRIKEMCLALGQTHAQCERSIQRYRKFCKTQAFYKIQEQKRERRWRNFVGLTDKNVYFLPPLVEEEVIRATCSNTYLRQTYRWRSSNFYSKHHPKDRVVKEFPAWKLLQTERENRAVLKKVLLANLDWRVARAERSRKLRILKTNPHFLEAQKQAVLDGWLELSDIDSSEFIMRNCYELTRIPGWSGFIAGQYNHFVQSYEWQMDSEDAHGEGLVSNIIHNSDTMQEDSRDISYAESFQAGSDSYAQFANAQLVSDEAKSCDRWYTFTNFSWSASDSTNKVLANIELPRYPLENFGTASNFMLFKQHVYWRGDMTIRVIVNSNLRQYGQLQARFYYGANMEYNFNKYKNNIYTGSQMPHCLISANTSNVGELHVPFEYLRPYLCVAGTGAAKNQYAILGSLIIAVIVPLTMAPGTETSCRVNLQIKFSNNQFSGQVWRGMVAQGPLTDFAIKNAMKFLNLDKPTNIQTGTVIVPQNVGSWTAGTGCDEWTVPLRLTPSAILPYGPGRIPNLDEMSINHIVSIYGLVRITNWKKDFHSGRLLDYFDASPTWEFNQYPKVRVDYRDCNVLPPVSMIANMFAYWRGSLSLRLDIVGAADLTGRLLVCYVPRINTNTLSIQNAFSCTHAIFDLQEKRQFVFEIPYVSDRMFWPRKYNMDRAHHTFIDPGKVFVFVYNDLIANLTIPSDCYINYYLSAGSDFEVSVPSQPNYGLCYNTLIWLASDTRYLCSFRKGYYPTYVGNWHSFGASKKCILRYGAVSDHITQIDVPQNAGEHLFKKVLRPLARFNCPIVAKRGSVIYEDNANYFVLFSDNHTTAPNYWYLIPFITKAKAQLFANSVEADTCPDLAEDYIQDSQSYASPVQMQFSPTDLIEEQSNNLPPYQLYHGQMDERSSSGVTLAPQPPPSSTGNGLLIMGEKFNDLKDLARRYQKYASGKVDVDPSKDHNFDSVQLRFPAMPQGLELDLGVSDNINEYWNRTREGPIPVIASGYRFFTGGLRFRILITTVDESGSIIASKLFVQHRPGFGGDLPVVSLINYKVLTTSDLEMPGFAYHIQNELINNIISVEVPFYLPSIRGYLQRPQNYYSSSLEHSLGEVVVSCKVVDKRKFSYQYEIYYSLADDSRFSIFQGFPPVFPIYNIPNIDINPTRVRREAPRVPILPPVEERNDEEPEVDPNTDFELIPPVLTHLNHVERLFDTLGIPCSYDGHLGMYIYRVYVEGSNSEDSNYDEWCHNFLLSFKKEDLIYEKNIKRLSLFTSHLIVSDVFPDERDEIKKLMIKIKRRDENLLIYLQERFSYDCQALWIEFYRIKNINDQEFLGQMYNLYNDIKRTARSSVKIASNLEKLNVNEINESVSSVKESATSVKSLASSLQGGIDYVTQMFDTDDDTGMLKGQDALDTILSGLTSLVINVSSFAVCPNVITFVTAVMNVLNQLKVFNCKFMSDIYNALIKCVQYLSGSREPSEEPSYRGQIDDDNCTLASYISTLVAGVAGLLNFTHSLISDKKRSLCKILLQDLKDFALTSNHLFTFCKNNVEVIKTIIEWLWKTSPDVKSLSFFEEFDTEIYEWAKLCLGLLDGTNKESLIGNLMLASQVYDCANQACLIQLRILDLKKNDKVKNDITPEKIKVILDLVQRICKLRDELARCHIAPPVKFEPYVVHIYGPPGIGKSFITQELPVELLQSINYKSYNEITFVRTPGNAYWNGLSHQPVLIYDDWYQSNSPEFGGIQVAELLQLKTRAVFNPPMAAVDDKNIRYNPLIVFLVSNAAFPKYEGVFHKEAIYRRVDLLVHCRKIHVFRNIKVKDIAEDLLQQKGHLEFFVHPDVTNHEVDPDNRRHIDYTTFKTELVENFRDYYKCELIKYKEMIKRITALYPERDEDIFKLPGQRFWTATDTYLKYVGKENSEFNIKYSNLIKEFTLGKIKSLKNVVHKLFNPFSGQIDDDDEVPSVSATLAAENHLLRLNTGLEPIATHSEYKYDPSYQCPRVDYAECGIRNCIHHDLFSDIVQEGADLSWNKDYQQWKVRINSMLWDWSIISRKIEENFPKELNIDTSKEHRETYFCFQGAYYLSLVIGEPFQKIDRVTANTVVPFIDLIIPLPNEKEFFFFPKSNILYYNLPDEEAIWFPHSKCVHPRCNFDVAVRNRFVGYYIQNNLWLENLLLNGEDITDEVPEEYIKGLNGIPVLENTQDLSKIQWLKGFFKNLCKKFTKPTLHTFYKWIIRISWFLVLISPIWRVWFAVNLVKDAAINPVELNSGAVLEWLRVNDIESYNRILKATSPQGFASGDNVHRGVLKTPKTIANKILMPHGQMNTQEFESLQNSLMKNTFFLVQTGGDGFDLVGRCLGIFGHCALIPTHYLESFDKDPSRDLYFVPSNCPIAITVDYNLISKVHFKDCSLSAIRLPKNISLFKDIRSRFASSEMHSKVNGVCTIVEIIKPSEKAVQCKCNLVSVIADFISNIKVLGSQTFGDFDVGDAYHYAHFTGKGRCGSVLLANNLPQSIIGMHVAGSQDYGISEAVSREMVDQIFDLFGSAPDPIEPILGQLGSNIPDTQVVVLGAVEPSLGHRENERSRIVPSLIQLRGSREDFPIYSDVAVLSPRDARLTEKFSPMHEGVKYHGVPLKAFDIMDMEEVERDIANMYLAKCVPVRSSVGKLSKLQACCGIEGLEGYDHLEWRTSEGYPFVSSRPRGTHDKKWLFDFDHSGICVGLHPELLSTMRLKKTQRLANEVPFTVFTDCLKDTTIPKEKVLLPGKTRVFAMAPVDFTIQQRQLTMDFCASMMKNRLDLEHAVGINPDSVEWTDLARILLSKGKKIVTGDFSKFGNIIPFDIILALYRLINKWYAKFSESNRERDDLQRKIMAYELGRALHLMFNIIYRVICGQPSGNALTVLINSYANSYFIRLAWLTIMRFTLYAGLGEFKKHVCTFSYGDDVIMSVSDEVAPYFNAEALHEFFASHNLKFTNADKSEKIIPFQSLGDSEFLKRSFALHPRKERSRHGILIAPLLASSIEDTINWVWNSGYDFCDERSPAFRDMCLQVCEDASRNAWTRGPEYYSKFCSKLVQFWSSQKVYVAYDSWDVLDFKIFDLKLNINDYKGFKINNFK